MAWNLVDGLHDAPAASERAVWVAGEPHELPPLAFATTCGGRRPALHARGARARAENCSSSRSDYEQPFGTFSGSCRSPGALREGWGVMERHEARW